MHTTIQVTTVLKMRMHRAADSLAGARGKFFLPEKNFSDNNPPPPRQLFREKILRTGTAGNHSWGMFI